MCKLAYWFDLHCLLTFFCSSHIFLSPTYTHIFEKKLRGKCFPCIMLSCFCWNGIQQSACRVNVSAPARESRALNEKHRQQSASETGSGSVTSLLYQHPSPGAEPLMGWNAWAPLLPSSFPLTTWTGRFCYCSPALHSSPTSGPCPALQQLTWVSPPWWYLMD